MHRLDERRRHSIINDNDDRGDEDDVEIENENETRCILHFLTSYAQSLARSLS